MISHSRIFSCFLLPLLVPLLVHCGGSDDHHTDGGSSVLVRLSIGPPTPLLSLGSTQQMMPWGPTPTARSRILPTRSPGP